MKYFFNSLFFGLLLSASCKQEVTERKFISKNVVLIVLDGIRYTDALADSTKNTIPGWTAFLNKGNYCEKIYNYGTTNTVNGLTSLSTGLYANLINNGSDTPVSKTIFHYFLTEKNKPQHKSAIFSSKDKIGVLQNSGNGQPPYTDCGKNGYRSDSITYQLAKNFVDINQPELLLVHFSEPDISGHSGNWTSYKSALNSSIQRAISFYDYLESLPTYKNQTTYFITTDHGRHTNNFSGHGDNCDGCKHLNLLCIGPDIKQGISLKNASQIDIPNTIAAILKLQNFKGNGRVLEELFL